MKYAYIILSLVLLLNSFLHAQEIEVSVPDLIGEKPAKVKMYDSLTKRWAEVDGHRYHFGVYLKNISNKPLNVVTGDLQYGSAVSESKQDVLLHMSKVTLLDGGAALIPPREKLKLVEIRPGEVAAVAIELNVAVSLQEVVVTYQPTDVYNGRFGYWTGEVKSKPWKPENKK